MALIVSLGVSLIRNVSRAPPIDRCAPERLSRASWDCSRTETGAAWRRWFFARLSHRFPAFGQVSDPIGSRSVIATVRGSGHLYVSPSQRKRIGASVRISRARLIKPVACVSGTLPHRPTQAPRSLRRSEPRHPSTLTGSDRTQG